jgi:hypothetical protein
MTCGLTTAGAPSVDQGEELALHGRISNTPAREVRYGGDWQGDDYEIWVEGKMRETRLFGENLLLTRRISAKMGEDTIYMHDIVENQGYERTPFMLLYHINGGFPAVDADSLLISPTIKTTPRDKDAEVEKELYYKFLPPIKDFKERVYYHDLATEVDGTIVAALVNKKIGFGFYIKYDKNELPFFSEWKMNGQGAYTVGMEPGNCRVEGRAKERERGTLQYLEPGEKHEVHMEIGVLPSNDSISALEERISEIMKVSEPL